jgi:hypothetical protein
MWCTVARRKGGHRWSPAFYQSMGKGAVVSLQLSLGIWISSPVGDGQQWKTHLDTLLPAIWSTEIESTESHPLVIRS